MNYYFKGFLFKSDQLVLVKQEETVNLRANEGKLLSLLLSDPEKVFSKDEILDSVWANKSVAEQSIFQNISNLRNIFGETAITTHPKKGYQWQIPLEDAPKTDTTTPPSTLNTITIGLALLLFLILLGISYALLSPQEEHNNINILVMPIELNINDVSDTNEKWLLSYNKKLLQELNQLQNIKALLSEGGANYKSLQASNSAHTLINKENSKPGIILSTKVRKISSTFFLSFNLYSKNKTWQGTFNAVSLDELINAFTGHLNTIINANILQTNRDNINSLQAQLRLLHDNNPTDIVILHQLIRNSLALGLTNQALLLSEKLNHLAVQLDSSIYIANALMIRSQLHHQQGDTKEAKNLLLLAKKALTTISDYQGLAQVAQQRATIALDEKNYANVHTVLSASINELAHNRHYFLQLDQMINLAVFANKLNKKTERDTFLIDAKRVVDLHNLPKEHYAKIYFQQGLFAEHAGKTEEAIRQYQWVIELFNPEQETWHKERAQFHLAFLLLREKKYIQAVELFKNEGPLTNKEKIILARIYKHGKMIKKSYTLAQQVFRDTLISGEQSTSLDAALILLELGIQSELFSQLSLVEHIQKQAMPLWKNMNKKRLNQLNIADLSTK